MRSITKLIVALVVFFQANLAFALPLINWSGFEAGDLAEGSANGGSPTTSTVIVRSGLYSLQILPATTISTPYVEYAALNASGSITTINLDTIKVTISMYPVTRPSSADEEIFSVYDNTTSPGILKWSLRMNSSGNLVAYDSTSAPIGTSSTVPSLNTWTTLTLSVGTGTSAAWEVKFDGSADMSGSTDNLGTGQVGRIRIGKYTNRNSKQYQINWDDLKISPDTYYLGEKIMRVPVSGDSAPTQWTGGTEDSDFSEIDETIRDEDASYIRCNNVAGLKMHQFVFQDISELGNVGVIKSVSVYARAKKEDAGATGSFNLRTIVGPVESNTSSRNLSNDYSITRKIFDEDPNGGIWTYDAFNVMEAAVIENNANYIRCTQVFAMILYNDTEEYPIDPLPRYKRIWENY